MGDIIQWVLLGVLLLLLLAVGYLAMQLRGLESRTQAYLQRELEGTAQELERQLRDLRFDTENNSARTVELMSKVQGEGQRGMQQALLGQLSQQEQRFSSFAVENEQKLEHIRAATEKQLVLMQRDNNQRLDEMRGIVDEKLQNTLNESLHRTQETIFNQLNGLEKRFSSFAVENEQKLENIRTTTEKQLSAMQKDNNQRLDEMRGIVDEKLQKTLEERMTKSFALVNERLEQVYRGLGEMQTLAVGVGDLKKVLSNVKTRGILGEVQLRAILEEILSPEQYEENVRTKAGSSSFVEFAIKLPNDDGTHTYLPIDAKFHGDAYAQLRDAYENGSQTEIDAAAAMLVSRIKQSAKDIRDKYIDPPNTTEFGILFVPFEGLYAELVNRGMIEVLQREYRINLAGPSTMAALLNSLQMGFRTFAIQKRSTEVWNVLGAVKTEFDSFAAVLESTQRRLDQANKELDKLVGVRTRQIQRKLKDVTSLSTTQSRQVLGDAQDYLLASDFSEED